MASLDEPDLRSAVPNARYTARIGTTVSLPQSSKQGSETRSSVKQGSVTQGSVESLTEDLSPGMLPPPISTSSSLASAAPSGPGGRPAAVPAPAAEAGAPPPQRIPRWLVRMELFLRVMLRMYIGLAVCYAPWSHTFWDQNPFFAQFPSLSTYAANGAVRGIISGLGLLNLWFAFHEALRHRDG